VTSSEIARFALIAQIVVAALVITSAQLRVLRRAEPRRSAYIVAWLVCTAVIAGIVWLTDAQVGNATTSRRVGSGMLAGFTSACALAAGEWWAFRPPHLSVGMLRFLVLPLIHLAIVVAIAWFFI